MAVILSAEHIAKSYTLKKLISLWVNGVTAFSIKPLRFASYVGWVTAAIGFLYALITIVRKLMDPAMQAGWASTIAILLVLGGVIISLMGIIGEYIGRIYLSINRYPQFVVRSVTRHDSAKEDEAVENDARSLGA